MVIGEMAASAAVDLAKNEGIQDKTTSLLGMLFPYAGIEKRALDMYVADIEKSDLSPESKLIAVLNAKETIKKLKNQHKVAEIAIENANADTVFDSSSGVNQEWFERFMDSAGFVSEEQVQIMWGKVLAKEFDAPGSTPFNMIRILSEITPQYAQAFQTICSMKASFIVLDDNGKAMPIRTHTVVPFKENADEMTALGLSFAVLNELDTLGLIKFDGSIGFVATNIPDQHVLVFCNGITKEVVKHHGDTIPIGNVVLTDAGECLDRITEHASIEGYENMVKQYLKKSNVVFNDSSEYRIYTDNDGRLTLHQRM